MTIFAAGSVPVSGMTWAGPHVCVALCARAVLPYSIMAATDSTGAMFSAACFSVIMFFAPLIRAAFDIPDHTENVARSLLDHGVGPSSQRPTPSSNRSGSGGVLQSWLRLESDTWLTTVITVDDAFWALQWQRWLAASSSRTNLPKLNQEVGAQLTT
jgi:hypothetical protein